MKEKEQVLYTSGDVATHVTNIEGWVDRHGRFWGKDEHMARWSGCTHIICPNCGNSTSKHYTICSNCRNKKAIERYNKKNRIKWDGKTPLYSEAADEYFFDSDELYDYMEEANCSIESLRLVICEPTKLRFLETDYWEDELPENGEITEEVMQAINDLNELLKDQPPASWYPGEFAARIPRED